MLRMDGAGMTVLGFSQDKWCKIQSTPSTEQLPDFSSTTVNVPDHRHPNMDDSTKHEFFRLSTQYYVAGRFAVSACLLPICGNLFHHAMEMYFKGVLSKTHTLSALRSKYGNHDLEKMWCALKLQECDAALDEFDQTIAELNEFEELRYPDQVLKTGMFCGVDFGDPVVQKDGRVVRPEPIYRFHIERVDLLVQVLFDKALLNPKAFEPMGSPAKKYLAEPSIAVAFV